MKENMLSDALKSIFGPLKNILDQCAGEKHELWKEILRLMSRMSPEKIHKALTEAESNKLWKRKVTVGGNTKYELLEKFNTMTYKVGNEDRVGIQVSEWAHDIANKPECVFSTEVEDGVEFVVGSLGGLFGFKKGTKARVFLDEAFLAKHDLEFCKPGDAFYIRINYTDQPLDEQVNVGMEPIIGSDHRPAVFKLLHDPTGVWLHANYHRPDSQWTPDNLWIFRRMTKIGV